MAEYIERYALLQKLYDIESDTGYPAIGWISLYKAVKKQSAADVAPVVHGRWIHCYEQDGEMVGQCSECHAIRFVDPYCPNCGAKMDGGTNG